MSRAYFIADSDPMDYSLDPIDEETRLKIDVADYKNKLRGRWPDIAFFEPYEMILSASLPSSIEGRAGLIIHIVGIHAVCLERGDGFYDFILWHRSYVPSKYRLSFSMKTPSAVLKFIPIQPKLIYEHSLTFNGLRVPAQVVEFAAARDEN